MAEEKQLGVKQEEVKPVGTDQPIKEPADIASEVDKVLEVTDSKGFIPKTEDYDDKSVVISKEDLGKLQKRSDDGEHYKQGLVSLKGKVKEAKVKPEVKATKPESEFLTKTEFTKSIEKTAILKACEDSEVNDNWEKVMQYYSPRRGKKTVEDIVNDIEDAKTLFLKYSPKEEIEDNTEEKELLSKVASETGKKDGVKPDTTKKSKKSILGKKAGPETWYV